VHPSVSPPAPERQNPLLVHRIVYFQDPTFRKLFDAQKGALPYPPNEAADVQVLTQRMEALERRLAERMVVDFVRPEKVKAHAPVALEPKLAAEILAREEVAPEVELAAVDTEMLVTVAQPEVVAEPVVDFAVLKPPITIAVSKMSKFSQRLTGVGGESAYGSDTQRRVQAGCGSHRTDQWPDEASGCV
jgi:type IV secretion system protein VirD4